MRILFTNKLAPAIQDYLEQCLEPSLDELHWSLYMCGHNFETARPYLVFSSTNAKKRKTAIELVRGSGILRDAPTVKLRHTCYIPGLHAPMELLGDHVRVDASHNPASNESFYYMPSENTLGVSVFVAGLPNESRMRQATAGGIICVGSRFFYLTVSHVLEQDEELQLPGGKSRNQSQILDEDDSSDEEEEEGGVSELRSDDSISTDGYVISTSSSCVNQYSEDGESLNEASHGILAIARLHDEIALFQVQRPLQSSTAQFVPSGFIELGPPDRIRSHKLDYLLIEIHDKSLIRPNILSASRTPLSSISVDKVAQIDNEDCDVAVLTASRGVLRGVLIATPRYLSLPKATTMRKTFSLRLDGIIQRGDCGSWVVDATSGHFYGHIFGGGAGTRTAYIIPAADIFDDIRAKCAQPVILPSATGENVQTHSRIPSNELHSGSKASQQPDSSGLQEAGTLEDKTVSKVNHEAFKEILDDIMCPGDSSNSTESLAENAPQKFAVTDRDIEVLSSGNVSETPKNHQISETSCSSPAVKLKPKFLEENSKPKSSFYVPSFRTYTSKHRDAAQDPAEKADNVNHTDG
ncbi:uncharacterized protein TRUGW13939_08881 [Talaromyces rugulosus]|uniref:Uncharacterized protein n=1 Tax=Talaromyces rugulosus TaxID=121627 RepID=A0A7H8R694_TALRU|nr:uncharacterized protein TRUGW13939_08881 [Talaromyces rugulosus]QKX61726.1 hypothetical protein TRUGW13939_08881 [Talaromyces rugulosus]